MAQNNKISISSLKDRKGRTPIVCLTAYTTPMAKMLDAHVDILLVGDSMGMVIYGMENTLAVDLEMMIRHGQAVVRGAEKACVVVDMPFGTYEESPKQAYRNAARILKETGCAAVKLEGGENMATTIEYMTERNIPVMAHIGLLPQSVVKEGGFKIKGKDAGQEDALLHDAKAVEEAGAFAVVIEGTVEDVAETLTKAISIPTIGIGASAACDGQVLVTEDMVGLTAGYIPKFVKQYARLGEDVTKAIKAYAADVKARKFPDGKYVYTRPKSVEKKDKAS